ncbi:hypothetical protein CPB83DRAFT_451089 [Crepidotus variabilis]|uniref:Uncharacterized protein n=1 Tax=Crepidotus variabilis TaxID=179855 RepID=A0A9P6ECU7_9AGAR|nr:hypothetical protein CPB83DRAFT_451089 [Crepidotus variabilis]
MYSKASTINKILHYIYINRMAQVKRHFTYDHLLFYDSEFEACRLRVMPSIPEFLNRQKALNFHRLHLLCATILFNSKRPVLLDFLWSKDHQIQVGVVALSPRWNRLDLKPVFRESILNFYHVSNFLHYTSFS